MRGKKLQGVFMAATVAMGTGGCGRLVEVASPASPNVTQLQCSFKEKSELAYDAQQNQSPQFCFTPTGPRITMTLGPLNP